MRLQNYPEKKLKQQLLDIVGRHLDLNKHTVFIFGSRVCGKGDERSDIDVGIEGEKAIPLSIMVKIREAVDGLPVLYGIDIVDFKRVEPEFREVAMSKIEKLN